MHTQTDLAAPAPATLHLPRGLRRAFTLTEMLVVITIVAILASLVSVAVLRALGTAKQTRIKAEVDAIDLALKAYKEKYGSYPPCDVRTFASSNRVKQHIARAFPRYDLSHLQNDMTAAGLDRTNFRPDQALVFWLRGFGPDPMHPFVTPDDLQINNGTPGAKVQRTSFFEFDTTRLVQVPTTMPENNNPNPAIVPSYFPAGGKLGAAGAPYLYWEASSYGVASPDPPTANRIKFNHSMPMGNVIVFANAGVAVPYLLDANGNGTVEMNEDWANPDSFQIIAAGIDNMYGTRNTPTATDPARLYPTGTNYDLSREMADDDNVTNFCQRARLGDAKP